MIVKKIFTGRVFLFLLLLGGCQWSVPKDPYTMVQSVASDPETLNPVLATSAYAMSVSGFIYEQLFELDNNTLKPKPRLAKHWEIAPDHLHYTFYLRDDVKWQDGIPFTADDVIYTYQKIMDPKVDAAAQRNYYRDILKAEKMDNYTVRFTYRQPYEGALTAIGLLVIIPKHIFDDGHDFNTHPNNRKPIGTGAFQFVEWNTGRYIALKKFDKHWAPEEFHIQKMVFKIIPDSLAAFQLFKKKELDLIDLNALQWARQTDTKKFEKNFVKHKLFTPLESPYTYVGWNTKSPYLKDKRVRWALAHLLDKKEINQKLLFGLDSLITGPYFPLSKKYNPNLAPIEYDLQEANRLLDAAGWKREDEEGIRKKEGIPLHFSLLFSGGAPFAEQLTPILQSNFKKAGIDLELSRLEFITMYKRVQEHDFDAFMGAWGRGVSEDLYQTWHSSQADGGSNFVSYSNPEVDHLLETARQEFDEEKQSRICQQIHKLIYEDQPYLFLFARPSLLARDARFKNVNEYPSGLDMREWRVEE